jgi:hypothetical protein
MTEERKHAILLATVILTARGLQPLLEDDDHAGKPNMGPTHSSRKIIRDETEQMTGAEGGTEATRTL